jgi:hypothetical protein
VAQSVEEALDVCVVLLRAQGPRCGAVTRGSTGCMCRVIEGAVTRGSIGCMCRVIECAVSRGSIGCMCRVIEGAGTSLWRSQ